MTAEANRALIERFYAAFGRCDGAAMTACYSDDAHFRDPAFGDLQGDEVGAMWRMLTGRATDLEIELREHDADEAVRQRPLDRPLHLLHRPPGRQRHPGQLPLRRRPDRRPRRRVRLPPLGPAGARPDRPRGRDCCRRCARRPAAKPAPSSTSSCRPRASGGPSARSRPDPCEHTFVCGGTSSRPRTT